VIVDKLTTTGKMRSFKFLKMSESNIQFCNRVGNLDKNYLCEPFGCAELGIGGERYSHLVTLGFSNQELNARASCGRKKIREILAAQEEFLTNQEAVLVA
jgi:hypothetical protein